MQVDKNGFTRKYKQNRDFFQNGFNRNKYPGWYASVVYFSAYHLFCIYYSKNYTELPKRGNTLYIPDELSKIQTEITLLESKARISLYGGIDAMETDLAGIDQAYESVESFMLKKIG